MAYLQKQLALLNLDTELDCYVSNGYTSFVGNHDTHTYIHSAVMGKDSVTSFGLMNLAPKSSSGVPVPVVFKNDSQDTVELMWYNYSGKLVSYGKIGAGQSHSMNTYATHPWTINDDTHSIENQQVWIPKAADKNKTVHIKKMSKPAGPKPEVVCKPKDDLMNLMLVPNKPLKKRQAKQMILLI